MKLCKKITGGIAKAAEVVCMVMIALLVVVIVTELLRRNFLNQSYRGTIEVCGIAFLWMAFIGLIPLYHNSGLMRLDFLVSHTKGATFEVLYFVNKTFDSAFKLTSELSSGNKGCKVKEIDFFVHKSCRIFTFGDFDCKPLCDSSFTNTRLAD